MRLLPPISVALATRPRTDVRSHATDPRTLLVAAAAVAVAALCANAAHAEPAMLLPVDAEGLTPEVTAQIDAALRAAVKEAGIDAQTADKTRELMQDAYAGGISCRYSELSCATRFAEVGSAPAVLVATVTSPPLVMRLARVDMQTHETTMAFGRFARPDDTAALQEIAARVAKPAGVLVVKVAPPAATVAIDGVDVGKAPLPPLAVGFGPHELKVALEGFVPQTRSVVVAGPDANEAAFQLDPATSPLLAAGTTTLIAGAVVGAGFGIALMVTEADLASPKDNSLRTITYGDEQSLGVVFFAGTVLGGLVAATGATLVGVALAE